MPDKAPNKVLHLYLPSPLREDAVQGRVNIINRIEAALVAGGWRLVFHGDAAIERARVASRRGFALFHMQEPLAPNTLCLRRAYHYPFWQIEATNERWNFDVAHALFDPASVNAAEAEAFVARWRKHILGDARIRKGGFVLMPLQGRLTQQRLFQAASPLEMIEQTLSRDPARPIVATLHPRETYTAAEHAGLAGIAARFPRFSVVPANDALLTDCDYVVTQNSSLALKGFFAAKPAVLFARVDFHHIAGSVPRDGLDAAFASAMGPAPDFTAYLSWFYRLHCINGGAADAEAQIRARLQRHGWPV